MKTRSEIKSERERERERERSVIYFIVWFLDGLIGVVVCFQVEFICDQGM